MLCTVAFCHYTSKVGICDNMSYLAFNIHPYFSCNVKFFWDLLHTTVDKYV